jgi:hypothetical protein
MKYIFFERGRRRGEEEVILHSILWQNGELPKKFLSDPNKKKWMGFLHSPMKMSDWRCSNLGMRLFATPYASV